MRWLLTLCALTSAACSASPRKDAAVPKEAAASPLPDSAFANTPFGLTARRGRAILTATRDSLPGLVGNGLRCTSCHLDSGRRPNAMPWTGVYARYPQYRSRAGRVVTIEDRVNECLERSLAGKRLSPDDDRMRAIEAYFAFISVGTTIGQRTPGQGIDSVHVATADTAAGRVAFAASCASCHGADGEGAIHASMKSDATPLWGGQSYTIAAGMGRYLTAAGFIWRNMPFDTPGSLTPQQALDVAAYIDAQARPDFMGKENDWPRGNVPADVPYKTGRNP